MSKLIANKNDLGTVSPDISKEWHETKNGNLKPSDVTKGSHKKIWWQCSKVKNHEWEARIKDRTREKKSTGCPHCYKNKYVEI